MRTRLTGDGAALLRRARHLGRARRCPCCSRSLRRFAPYGAYSGVLCPFCGSLPRHRTAWLYLARELNIETRSLDVLHYAPEPCLVAPLRRLLGDRHVTIDLTSDLADRRMDAADLQLADVSFDLLICSHVLEHVEDDHRALREMHRVLRPGGTALLQHPVVPGQATFENPAIVDPSERARLFSQPDHVRVYGSDIVDRLARAGFRVSVITPESLMSAREFEHFGLAEPLSPAVRASDIYRCTPERRA